LEYGSLIGKRAQADPNRRALKDFSVALSELDRNLLQRCLGRKPKAWEEFVDRFVGLLVHVVNHTASSRGVRLQSQDREDMVALILLHLVKNDMALLRQFRGECSFAPYLTVIARRISVHELLRRGASVATESDADTPIEGDEQRIADREEIERLLEDLNPDEARAVRMFHLEGRNYREISSATGMPENSIGPMLSRARTKLRSHGAGRATS
jgi:RNA polymerase sigma-70 factor (ECF subfamily)